MVVWHGGRSDTINAVFDRVREAHGGQTFLDFPGDEYTYARLGEA